MLTPHEPSKACRRRRDALAAALRDAGGGVAVLPTALPQVRNSDVEFPFRPDSYFHYLTGFDEPSAWLVVTAEGRSLLFCRPRHPERELWEGRCLGPEAAPSALGVDEARAIDELDASMPALLTGQSRLWLPFGLHTGLEARAGGWLEALRQRARRSGEPTPTALADLRPLLDEMRLVKDAQEQALMRQAGRIAADGHVRAMRHASRRLRAEPAAGIPEYEIEAELLYEFRRRGAQSPAYPSIVAAGANACVLHYPAGNALLRAGELCLIDAGCELDGYASDITRTWPADGRFRPAQRELYELVLAAQDAAIAVTRPGERKQAAHHAAVRVLSQGLLDLGLLSRDRDGDLDAVIESAAYRRFYMHGTGHWLGRDVHDVGDYFADEPPAEEADGVGGRVTRRPSRHLVPGMVLTIEPGLYVQPAEDVPERYWNIGIRIEDNALVTDDGCELLSRGVPVGPDEIEALMREA